MDDHKRLCGPGAPTRVPVGRDCGPRYKENLPSKCYRKHKHRPTCPTSLNSLRWIFVKKGLDDFRKGCPPCEGLITRGPQEAFLPQIHPTAPRPAPKKRQHRRPKEAASFSKLSPAQQAQKAFLADVQAQLTPHPLALYPNLGEDMPVELLLKVLEVLDPVRKLEDTWAYCQGIRKRTKEPAKLLKKHSTEIHPGLPKKTPGSHPGQWLFKEKKPSETDLLHQDGPLLHENVRKGVSDFCNWATSFGSSNIDEEFILKQFDIDHWRKPSHDVLHTMRLNQVPLELKKLREPQFFQKLDCEQKHRKLQSFNKHFWVSTAVCREVLGTNEADTKACFLHLRSLQLSWVNRQMMNCHGMRSRFIEDMGRSNQFHQARTEGGIQNSYKPKYVKMKYGAWYLNTKLWKKQRADEPLVDPKVSCKAQDENFKKELQERGELLADLHGTIAFKDFILSRGYRMPRFLEKMYIRKEC